MGLAVYKEKEFDSWLFKITSRLIMKMKRCRFHTQKRLCKEYSYLYFVHFIFWKWIDLLLISFQENWKHFFLYLTMFPNSIDKYTLKGGNLTYTLNYILTFNNSRLQRKRTRTGNFRKLRQLKGDKTDIIQYQSLKLEVNPSRLLLGFTREASLLSLIKKFQTILKGIATDTPKFTAPVSLHCPRILR